MNQKMKKSKKKAAKAAEAKKTSVDAKKAGGRKASAAAKQTTRVAKEEPKLYKTANDLPKQARVQVIQLLNARLADAVDLHMQMKQAHWNVKGPNFIGLHELFDKIHAATGDYVDMIAERAVQLGGVAEGTVRVAAKRTQLGEYPHDIADGPSHVNAVSIALAAFAHEVRSSINEADDLEDADTADLFTEVSRGTDKWLWFVEAHAQAAK
ncbi:MAG: DNA starvation/stationary phase protection protein Dps [Flavobacteriales bacterium]